MSMRTATIALAALVATAALVPACTPNDDREGHDRVGTATMPIPGPLVLVAVDGLEWRLVLEMQREGRLPALARLMDEGTFARLSTLEPALSPPIWTSIATGVLPSRHGILGFERSVTGDDGRAMPAPFTNADRRVKALWNIADDAGLSSCILGYWMTWPVETIRGVMVAQTSAPPGQRGERTRKGGLAEGQRGQVHPETMEARIFATASAATDELGEREREIFGEIAAWPPAMQRLVAHSRWSLAADTAYRAIALDLLRDPERCDMMIVYLGLADVLGHRFWRWTKPRDFASPPPADEVARYGEVLRRAYESIDGFVARLREHTGSRATVVVASDHGMGAFRPDTTPDLQRRDGALVRTGGHSASREALFVAAGPGIAKQDGGGSKPPAKSPATIGEIPRAGAIVDMTPTLLALLGLADGEDMDGITMTSLLDPGFLAAHPQKRIPTHTPPDWNQGRSLAATDAPDQAERREQLRALGYLD
jgi:hypothetical protein